MANTQKIKIDGVEYALNELTDQARNQLLNLRAADQEIARLQVQMAIAQTARAAYANALAAALPQADANEAGATEPKKGSPKKAAAKKS